MSCRFICCSETATSCGPDELIDFLIPTKLLGFRPTIGLLGDDVPRLPLRILCRLSKDSLKGLAAALRLGGMISNESLSNIAECRKALDFGLGLGV